MVRLTMTNVVFRIEGNLDVHGIGGGRWPAA
jgi:hypothetical protein